MGKNQRRAYFKAIRSHYWRAGKKAIPLRFPFYEISYKRLTSKTRCQAGQVVCCEQIESAIGLLDTLQQAQEQLAHSDIKVTNKHYCRKGTVVLPAKGFFSGAD